MINSIKVIYDTVMFMYLPTVLIELEDRTMFL